MRRSGSYGAHDKCGARATAAYQRITDREIAASLEVVSLCCMLRAMAKPAREPHLPPLQRPLPVSSGAQSKQREVTGDTVPATKLAGHLDLTHQRIRQLVDESVIVQLPDGRFDMDDARTRYLSWLRDPERRSARTQADAEHVKAKTEMLQLSLLRNAVSLSVRCRCAD